jgi:hypothetical protein
MASVFVSRQYSYIMRFVNGEVGYASSTSEKPDCCAGVIQALRVAHGFIQRWYGQVHAWRQSGRCGWTFVLTDIATGWTECAPLLVREQTLLTAVLSELRVRLPFPLLGVDCRLDLTRGCH